MTLAPLLLVLCLATPSNTASSEPVLLDFHADWCGPCRQMRTAIAQLTRKGYPIKSVDIDQAPRLREKYRVEAVPTFIVVDSAGHELGRTSGSQPAAQLARFYLDAKAKAQPPANSRAHSNGEQSDDAGTGAGDDDDADKQESRADGAEGEAEPRRAAEASQREQPVFENPRPWETVVRIRVLAQGSVGFGSGTIIYSSPQESLILTCAHIFKLEGSRQPPPDRFPRKIMIDLFDGKLHGEHPAQVHYVESVEGRAVDYDFGLDVGLIRIRPDRKLAAARVVPAHWEPRARMKMLTVGCSEGHDATAWHTVIVNPQMRGLSGNDAYQAIECLIAPKQGRSGGGLFTTDGYIAGVCNFAEPRGDHGLYATPRSIYGLLDRNRLMALYAPVSSGSGTLLADRGKRQQRDDGPITIARGQSPEPQDSAHAVRPGEITVPPPALLGIKAPGATRLTSADKESSTRRMAWHPTHTSPAPTVNLEAPQWVARAQQTDLSLDPEADHDRFSHFESDQPATERNLNPEDVSAPAASSIQAPARSRWRPSGSSGTPISEPADR
jgi:thiol-disulfide isomerase/thioredoxin